jgi:NAD+ synthetase
MALSNKFGWLVLTTGNKSEMATGFTTLYGDMAGGFAVIKDVPKTLEYKLVRYRNSLAGKELIPASVLKKEPSPELKPDQKTVDITLKGTDVNRNEVQFGAGYSQLDGFFGQFQFNTRNFLGRGDTLGIQFQKARLRTSSTWPSRSPTSSTNG